MTTKLLFWALLALLSTKAVTSFTVVVNVQNGRVLTTPVFSSTTCTASSSLPTVAVVDNMPEPLPDRLRNDYYLLRHGQSTANVQGIISSNRYELAYTDKHGLTDEGYQQGKDSAEQVVRLVDDTENVVFVSSPFARARQTAQACLDGLRERGITLSTSDIQLHNGLMERSFGRLDAEAIYTYSYVWPLDKFNVTHTAFDVESVAAVCHRFRDVVLDLESRYEKKSIVLVGHADVLQIAQLYAARAENVGTFSSYRFRNGEVRAMRVNDPSSLPLSSPLEKPERGTKTG